MKVLLLFHKLPFPVRDGGAYALCETAECLASQGAETKILAVDPPKDAARKDGSLEQFAGRHHLVTVPVDTRVKPWKAWINLWSARSYFVERFRSGLYDSQLKAILQEEKFDLIQLEHIYMCLYLRTIRKHSEAPVILRPQNVENSIWKQLAARNRNLLKKAYLKISADRLFNFEAKMSKQVDGIMAISDNDAAAFRSYAPKVPVIPVAAGFDPGRLAHFDFEVQYRHFPAFYHLGSMDWLPNVEGMKWFISEAMPAVINLYPGFKLHLAGKKMPAWFSRREGKHLMVHGEIEDPVSFQENKPVMIVPLQSGSGLRIKIIEAMALGKTVISTPIGAEGIPCRHDENILIADTKEEFAFQIKRCSDSMELCKRIGNSARSFAQKHYDRNALTMKMTGFYNQIAGKPGTPARSGPTT